MKSIARKQGRLFFPLLTLAGINLHYLRLEFRFIKRKVKGRWVELSLLALRFAAICIPPRVRGGTRERALAVRVGVVADRSGTSAQRLHT